MAIYKYLARKLRQTREIQFIAKSPITLFMKESQDSRLDNDKMLRSLREQKEHNEKQVESLLEHFYNEDKYKNELRFFGDKYQKRIREFETLQFENEELKNELFMLRKSIDMRPFEDDSSHRDTVDRGKLESISRGTNSSAREEFKSKLDDISKLKDEAKTTKEKETAHYDELVFKIYKFLEQAYSTQKLFEEMKPSAADTSEEMVLVPKKRYEQLIEIYAINMANITAEEFKTHLGNKAAQNAESINYIEESKRVYKEKYANIIKDSSRFQLEQFFHQLAQKFGFQNQWERYYIQNTEQSVKLKKAIQKIIASGRSLVRRQSGQERQDCDENMREKLSMLVNELNFSRQEKEYWSKINQQLRRNQLFDTNKLISQISKAYAKKDQELIQSISALLECVLQECFGRLAQIFNSRFRQKDIWSKVKPGLSRESIQQALNQKKKENQSQQLWLLAKDLTSKKIEDAFKIIEKHLVFQSINELYKKAVKTE